ncbi:hypothetical protein HAX54_001060, partial [Datura stramonium]|nr:hypothetical protein [Datura stramonium]
EWVPFKACSLPRMPFHYSGCTMVTCFAIVTPSQRFPPYCNELHLMEWYVLGRFLFIRLCPWVTNITPTQPHSTPYYGLDRQIPIGLVEIPIGIFKIPIGHNPGK